MSAPREASRFGQTLLRYRKAAGLTQEELAERAHLSVRAISDLERGLKHVPRRDTVALLANALDLDAAARKAFAATARPSPGASTVPEAVPAAAEAPPPPRHNLPRTHGTLFGRLADRGAIRARLAQAALVTLTGSGGVGKTRLALAVAEELVDSYQDGVWLVELAALAEPRLIPVAIGQILGVREESGRPPDATLIDHLKHKRLLLLLDNCEHLVIACAALATALLRACHGLTILATSREGLEITGERQYRVPSLPVPDPSAPAEAVGEYASVRLFVARAQERRADFALTPENALVVARICALLDGIPLAIELAAVRVANLPLAVIAARLDDRFALLTRGPRDAPWRQQTLGATIEWSWELLDTQEQTLLARLSVFAGGWSLAAAEAVCVEHNEGRPVPDLLASLVDKSLVLMEGTSPDADQVRYRLLETVRAYASVWLRAGVEETAVRDRHLAYVAALAEKTNAGTLGPEQHLWLAHVAADLDNVRTALTWSMEGGDGALGLQVAGALWRSWSRLGHLSEGRTWLAAVLARNDGASSPPAHRARALDSAGHLAAFQGDILVARASYEEALALWRELGNARCTANSLNSLGVIALDHGDYALAQRLLQESLALFRETGLRRGIAYALNNLAEVALARGEPAQACATLQEGLALCREIGDTAGVAEALMLLGWAARQRSDYGQATMLLEEALALSREVGDKQGIAIGLRSQGLLAHQQGNHALAAHLLRQSVLLGRDMDSSLLMAGAFESLAWVAAAEGQTVRGARLGGAAETLREAHSLALSPHDQARHDRAVQALRAGLDEAPFAVVWAEGRALSLAAAVALALDGHDEAPAGGFRLVGRA